MQLYSFEGWLPFIVEGFYKWFSFYCIICLLARLLTNSKIKHEATNVQAAANLAIAIAGIINMVMWIILFFYIQDEQTGFPRFPGFSGFYFTDQLFFCSLILLWIISILFLFKYRRSWLLSVLALLCVNSEFMISLAVRTWRDYLPSSWMVSYDKKLYLIQFFSFTLLSLFLYWWLARQKKLPYPSAWLR